MYPQQKTYKYCDFQTLKETTITMGFSGDTYTQKTVTNGNGIITEEYRTYQKFYIKDSITGDIRYDIWGNIKYDVTEVINENGEETTAIKAVRRDIPINYSTDELIKYVTVIRKFPYYKDGDIIYTKTITYDKYILLDQQYIPTECTDQPSGCAVTIISATATAPTFRGTDDGKITLVVSGCTGATNNITYNLNGAEITTTGNLTGYTYTGLKAGKYVVLVRQGLCYDQETVYVTEGQFKTGDLSVYKPKSITAVNNPIVLKLGTAINSALPLKSKSRIYFNETVTEGTTITITLTYPINYTATFTSRYFPNSNSYFLCTALKDSNGIQIGTNTADDIALSIAQAIQSDTILSRLYNITNVDKSVYIEAKEPIEYLDLTTSNCVINNNQLKLETIVNGSAAYDGALSSNYSLYCELFINPNLQYGATPNLNDFYKIGELELPFQSNNIHQFQLDSLLKNYTSTPAINFGQTGFTSMPAMIIPYYVKYGEKFPLIENSNTIKKRHKGTTDVLYAINSALNYEDANDMESYDGISISGLNPLFTITGDLNAMTLTATDYLEIGGEVVTDIQFKAFDWVYGITYDWQTGNTFTVANKGTYEIYIKGKTNGNYYTVSRKYLINDHYMGYSAYEHILPQKINNVKWLTNSPSSLYVQRNSKQYLSFLLKMNYGKQLDVKGDIYYYDGTSTTGVTFFNITSGATNYGGVTLLACGYDELGLEALENSGNTKVRRVDFAVYQTDVYGSVPLTEIKTFLYEIDEMPTRFGTAFLNKLGTWDIFDWVGEIIQDENISRNTINNPRTINFDGSSPYGFKYNSVYDTKYTKKFIVNSGIIDADTYNWLQELLQSNVIYNYTSEHQNYLMVDSYLSSKSTNTNEYTIQVTFIETINENNVSI